MSVAVTFAPRSNIKLVIHKGLIIMDVFKRQLTLEVLTILSDNNICLANIPPNKAKYYQPLDFTVNQHAKRYLKNKFSRWYGNQISKQFDKSMNIDAVDVNLRLTTLKPLHA